MQPTTHQMLMLEKTSLEQILEDVAQPTLDAQGVPVVTDVSAGAHRLAVLKALATVAADANLKEPVLWEAAACDPDHEDEWDGVWEVCTLEKEDDACCTVRLVKDCELRAAVPRRFVRRSLRPVNRHTTVLCHLNTVHDLKVLSTMAVLASDLAVVSSSTMAFPTSFERLVLELSPEMLREHWRMLQMQPEHWQLLAPLLRRWVLMDPTSLPAYEWDKREQSALWVSLLLRAIDGPRLILRKEDALVLAKRLLASARQGESVGTLFKSTADLGAECRETLDPAKNAMRELLELLGAMDRAHGFDEPTLALVRVAAFTMPWEMQPRELGELLSGYHHVPPACSPSLEPLTADLPASSECVALLVDKLARLGMDALSLALLHRMTLRAKRAVACSCRGLRTLITPHLRAATLHVLAEDATLDNAAFVARLPTLERLHVEGESFLCDGLDIPKLRSLHRIALKTIGAPAAMFLGCLLSGGEHIIRLSNGVACISLQPIATRVDLSLVVVESAADLAVLLGSLSSNGVLQRLKVPQINWLELINVSSRKKQPLRFMAIPADDTEAEAEAAAEAKSEMEAETEAEAKLHAHNQFMYGSKKMETPLANMPGMLQQLGQALCWDLSST